MHEGKISVRIAEELGIEGDVLYTTAAKKNCVTALDCYTESH